MGLGVQNIVGDGMGEAIGGGADASEGDNALGWEGEAPVEDEGVGVGVVREEVAAVLGGGRAWGVVGGVHIVTTSDSSFARCSSD